MSTSSFPPPPPPPPAQFGAPVFPQTTSASSQLLMSSSSPPTSVATSSAPSTPCCDTGRPILTDPHTGQTVCSCQYSPPVSGATAAGLLAAYPRIPGLPEGLYNPQYAAAAAAAAAAASQAGLMPLTDPSAFYPAMGAYDLKSLAGSPTMYAYDPNMGPYAYPNQFLDPNARRKNATRESTQTLKAWLQEHKKNPYPTKGEKIMLAIITKMTLTQVSTWFANARRRLKKENKMTWEPRNRADDEDDDDDMKMDSDTERTDIGRVDDDDDMEEIDIGTESEPEEGARHISDSRRLMENLATSHALHSLAAAAAAAASASSSVIPPSPSLTAPPHPHPHTGVPPNFQLPRTSTPTSSPPASPHPSAASPHSAPSPSLERPNSATAKDSSVSSVVIKCSTPSQDSHNSTSTSTPPASNTKPKIWSMADIATSASTKSTSAASGSPPPGHPAAVISHRPRSPPRMPGLHHGAPRPAIHPGFPYSWPGLPYGLPPHLMPQVSTAALLSRYGLAMGAAPTMVSTSATSAFCRPPPVAVAPGGERRELHATGVKSSSPAESPTGPAPPLHTAFRPVPKSKPTQPIHV